MITAICSLQRRFLGIRNRRTASCPAAAPLATPRCGNVDALFAHILQYQIDGRYAGEKKNQGDKYDGHG